MPVPEDLTLFDASRYDRPRLPSVGTVLTALLLSMPFIADRFL